MGQLHYYIGVSVWQSEGPPALRIICDFLERSLKHGLRMKRRAKYVAIYSVDVLQRR